MKETIEKELPSNTTAVKLEKNMKKDGWHLKRCRTVTIFTFEREIPDQPDDYKQRLTDMGPAPDDGAVPPHREAGPSTHPFFKGKTTNPDDE